MGARLRALWRRVWSDCWLWHEPRVPERDPHGRLVLVCPRCRNGTVVNLSGARP